MTAGRLIIVGFSPVTDFCEATCKQYEENVCNRGGYCKKKKWQVIYLFFCLSLLSWHGIVLCRFLFSYFC
jgi:hypothetical protein